MQSIYGKIDANKILIDKVRPLEGHYLKQIREYYRIGLTWTSNALEGNTLNETETKILQKGLGYALTGDTSKECFFMNLKIERQSL